MFQKIQPVYKNFLSYNSFKKNNSLITNINILITNCVGEMVISSEKYDVQLHSKSVFEVRMTLVIRNLHTEDLGSYRCIAKNSLGEVESNIRLYGK